MGADRGRFLCLTAGCGGTSYSCPLFSPRSGRQDEIKSKEEKTRGLGKVEKLKLSFYRNEVTKEIQ